MHSRERREFGRRKMRVRNKWEVALVLVVIAAGIVITTVAAIKAKERRQTQSQSRPKSVSNSTKSSVSHVREVLSSQSSDHNNRKAVPALEKVIKRPKSESQPDYDVEYDPVKSGADEYAAMASEAIDTIPRNRVRVQHDGLPGFPAPFGVSSDFGSANVELSADAAGFVLEPADQNNQESNRDEIEFKDFLFKSGQTNSDRKTNLKPTKVKSSVRFNNNNPTNNRRPEAVADNTAAKSEPKRTPMFSESPKEATDHKPKPIMTKPLEVKPDMKVAIPMKVLSRLPIGKERIPILGNGGSEPMRFSLPNLEPAIRFLGMSDDYHHATDPQLQAQLANIPINMRRFLPESDNPDQNHNQNPGSKVRSKRESERRFVLRQFKKKDTEPKTSAVKVNYKENEPKTGESRFYPFNERSFISDNEDNDREDSEEDEIRPLFNFEDLENRFPSVLSSNRDHKRNDDNYSSDESREKHKYGLLGSGNFEIIRGGVYADEESASNNAPNYVQDSDNSPDHDNNSNHEQNTHRKSEPEPHSHLNYEQNSEPNSEDDNEQNQFSPFNIDFFTGRPVLGFQGYDNFGATNVEKLKAPAEDSGLSGQRRHFYDPYSADSNLHVISTDQDLDSDS